MKKVVSLLPSATEIVFALDCGERLIGRSHECDHPLEAERLPVCTAPNFAADGSSREIDGRVKSLLHQALSIYRIDTETLARLQPEVILTQTQCEVCAVSLEEVEQALAGWVGAHPRVVSLEPALLGDVWRDIERVAEALGVPERAAGVVTSLYDRVERLTGLAARQAHRPRVVCVEWLEPLMAAGNWVPELVTLAGGANLIGRAGHHSPWMTFAQIQEADPDILLLMPCGFDMDKTESEAHWLTGRKEWQALRAVREGSVVLVDGNRYFNRPGPRLVESLEILAEILHPEVFRFGHRGQGWRLLAEPAKQAEH